MYAGSEEDAECLERFKTRVGLKSVPFYVVIGKDGRIEQVRERGSPCEDRVQLFLAVVHTVQ